MIKDRKSNKNLTKKKYKKGQIIFREGDFEILMYAIDEGSVKVVKDFEGPGETELTTLYEGDTFGEMGLIDSMPRSATVIAKETTTVTLIDNVGFGEYFKDKPAKVVRIMQQLSSRMRYLTNEYMDACKTISRCLDANKKGEKLDEEILSKMEMYSLKYTKQ